jgi:hypothetical protein
MSISKPATIIEAKWIFVLAKGKIIALTGQNRRLRRMGLSTKMEKEKGVAGNWGVQSCRLITAFLLSLPSEPSVNSYPSP